MADVTQMRDIVILDKPGLLNIKVSGTRTELFIPMTLMFLLFLRMAY
jgi:hypothetical protein